MKPVSQWIEQLGGLPPDPRVVRVEGRTGEPTLRVGDVLFHSRYDPRKEAVGLTDSAGLDLKRPVLVVGIGMGYHVLELLRRGVSVAVVEPDKAVAKLAVEGPLGDSEVLLGVGDPEEIAGSEAFKVFAETVPQIFIHPPTARAHPQYAAQMTALLAKSSMGSHRLRVAIVGPMFGGSLPIAAYLERGFKALGHVTRLVDNSLAWDLYSATTNSIKTKRTSSQLGDMLMGFLGEWSYARVSEFSPDICIVMAQAPVDKIFPIRLARDGIVTAFWYVENWRHLPYWREVAPYYDAFFHIQPGEFEQQLTNAGCPCHAFVQTACDPEVHKPVTLTDTDQREFACDLSFAGAGYPNRVQLFKGLTDYDFKLWGVGWKARELQHLVCRPEERFSPEQFAKIVAGSKVNLNLHSSTTHDGVDPKCDAINPRVFEIAACGGFQLCDPCIGLESLFDFDSELPVYRDLAELREKLDYFLRHPKARQDFARRARERALRDHTYAKRAQQMLDVILERYGARILRKGIRVQRTVAEVAERVGGNSELGMYLASLPPDLIFTQETINDQLTKATTTMCYPEKVFAYLREMRHFAETLLALR